MTPRPLPAFLALLLVLLCGCQPKDGAQWQGYIEGDFVGVGSPLGGRLDRLAVARGDRVESGADLFCLEDRAERATQAQAVADLSAARSRLADLEKGARPSELAALNARDLQARAAAELSARDLARARALYSKEAIADSDLDRARLLDEANRRAVEAAGAELDTARLGGRPDAVQAARSAVAAAEAAVARADWAVDQKRVGAPAAGLVFDTLYRQGEFVAAGNPVLVLLPPGNIRVRFFVPEPDLPGLQQGDALRVFFSGRTGALPARLTYISPEPEYTPPVLYNRENRAKLVYRLEGVFAPEVARGLHPGEPVEVEAGPGRESAGR